ncbi:MAG: prepilin-type N-terminal cleavage/methylation domain-containing protein [Verrucomicrobia bacterium]|nr:prepilin-type N-terminal cleavage/methylation domain-containing protein [Verrucomicrobiota bacterium]MCH8514608.1 prepilin-type N-terminal cleavage/methylation domain-containing protein [Kiritimatiellia bacterium]
MKKIYKIRKVDMAERKIARSGFTLVEIMMVIMLIGLFSAYAVTSARARFPRMRVDQVSSRLAFKLQMARSEAIAENEIVFVSLDPSTLVFRTWRNSDVSDGAFIRSTPNFVLGDPKLVNLVSDWEEGAFNAYGQFITTPGQREMKTVKTVMTSAGGGNRIELVMRGSGAITKR